jgi:hypothetical protein
LPTFTSPPLATLPATSPSQPVIQQTQAREPVAGLVMPVLIGSLVVGGLALLFAGNLLKRNT